MIYDEKTETYTFASGRIGRANCGIIGISAALKVSDGYDSGFPTTPSSDATPFTQAERDELADYMIGLWMAFKTVGKVGA